MMNYSTIRIIAVVLVALALAGCAAQRAYQEGNDLVEHDQVEAGLAKYREAVTADPSNALYKMAYLRARDAAIIHLLEQADAELASGRIDQAQQDLKRVLAFAPSNERALSALRQAETAKRQTVLLSAATEAFNKQDYSRARNKLDAILSEQPKHAGALALQQKINDFSAVGRPDLTLSNAYRKPISLEFHDAPLRQILEVIGRHSGLNFVFDKEVRADQHTSIFLKNSTVEAAVYFLLITNQLDRQVMDRNTILIYPNNAAKAKEYQELTVKTFYLANADAKSLADSLKTILKSRDIAIDEKLNLVILRDNQDGIRLASRIVALLDVPEPEVMLDVEVMEVQRNRATELGVLWPTSLSFAPVATSDGRALTVDALRGLNARSIGVGGVAASINAHKDAGDVNTLANPSIRVRNKEKAKVVIGEKLPIITTTVSPGVGGFASESVTYADVGLTLNVEPTIHLDNDVAIKISLEVSNVIDSMTTKSGSTVYRIGNRSATTLLQLKDGENQVLAGLIQNEDRTSGAKLPILGDVPLLGRLFGSTSDSNDKTEVVLSITPHLVRNIQRPPAEASEFAAGTDASFRLWPDAIGSAALASPFDVVANSRPNLLLNPVPAPQAALPPPPVSGLPVLQGTGPQAADVK